jgi:hypothetical protein
LRADGRPCLAAHSRRATVTYCDWKIGGDGIVRRSPEPARRPSLADAGVNGRLEAARARSPRGDRVAIATYTEVEEEKRDLRISVVGSAPPYRLVRSVVVDAEAFTMDATGIASEDLTLAEGTYMDPPTLTFIGDRFVAFTATYYPHCKVVDLDTGEVTTHSECGLTGGTPAIYKSDGVLLDPASGPPVLLRASPEEWAAALDIGPLCD